MRVEVNPVGARRPRPQQVVQGFIRAAAASDDQYQVARSYLAPGRRGDLAAGLLGRRLRRRLRARHSPAGADGTVTAVATAIARIDGTGRYQELPPTVDRAGDVPGSSAPAASGGSAELPRQLRHLAEPGRPRAALRPLPDLLRVGQPTSGWCPTSGGCPLGTGLATRLARVAAVRRAGLPQGRGPHRRPRRHPAGGRRGHHRLRHGHGRPHGDPARQRPRAAPEPRRAVPRDGHPGAWGRPGRAPARGRRPADAQRRRAPSSRCPSWASPTPSDPVVKPLLRMGSDPGPGRAPTTSATPVERTPPPEPPTLPDGRSRAGPTSRCRATARRSPRWAATGRSWRGGAARRRCRSLDRGTRLTRPTYDREDVLWVAGRSNGATKVWAVNAAADPGDAAKAAPQVVGRRLAGRAHGGQPAALARRPAGRGRHDRPGRQGPPGRRRRRRARSPTACPPSLAAPLRPGADPDPGPRPRLGRRRHPGGAGPPDAPRR